MIGKETAKLLQAYIAAFERGDFELLIPILEVAQTNQKLEKLIIHYHTEHEEDVPLTSEQHTRILALLKQQEIPVKRDEGTFDEIYSHYGAVWAKFGTYGAIVAGISPDSPKRYLNLVENIDSRATISCHLEIYESQDEMFKRLYSLGLPENAVWQRVKEEEQPNE